MRLHVLVNVRTRVRTRVRVLVRARARACVYMQAGRDGGSDTGEVEKE